MNTQPDNPYVGPRSFRREEASRFFGRESEARDLLSLVISEQLVLFYAQSGAGKSSLINTSLIPSLEEKGFEVLPVGRVSSALMNTDQVDNIYVFNLLLSLDQSKRDPRRFSHISLTDFLNNLARRGEQFLYDDRGGELPAGLESSAALEISPRALVIDQFEEIVTTHPEAWQKREDFFRQLADAMEADPYLWVILVMREDFVAALDPYAHLLPGQLRARYYMRRMGVQSALDAIRKPVEKIRAFEPGVAELLVDNMRLISSSGAGGPEGSPVYGEYVEPVQLQVVCFQLWERLQQSPGIHRQSRLITREDLTAISKGESIAQFISTALADFYEQAISRVLSDPAVSIEERDLRDWFSHELITEGETRGFVHRGAETTAGLPNKAVDILASQYIVRSESKAGGVWIELVHDRFVNPILQANRKWAGQHEKSVLTDATLWKNAGQADSHLYDGKQLEGWLAELESHPDRFTTVERDFLRASQRAAAHRRQRFLLSVGSATVFVILGLAGLLLFAVRQTNEAQAQATAALGQLKAYQGQSDLVSELNLSLGVSVSNVETLQAVVATQTVQIATLGAGEPAATAEIAGTEITVPTPSSTTTPSLIGEELIGSSVNGNPLFAYHFGNGPRHVVFIGGLHAGFAPSTVTMAERLKAWLTNNVASIPPSVTVDLIVNANPDSTAPPGQNFAGKREGRLNANQVDLNRNWECDWRADAEWANTAVSGGRSAFSEPETIALRDFLTKDKLTVAVVFWEARDNPPSVAPGGCGDYSVYSDPLSRLYAAAAGYRAHDFVAYEINGDGTNWLDRQGIGAVSVLLPDYTNLTDEDFNANLNAVKQILEIYGR
jgi:hypothetical protein